MIPNNVGHYDEFPGEWQPDEEYNKGWKPSLDQCPECGGDMLIKEHEYNGVTEIERCCMSCEFCDIYYD